MKNLVLLQLFGVTLLLLSMTFTTGNEVSETHIPAIANEAEVPVPEEVPIVAVDTPAGEAEVETPAEPIPEIAPEITPEIAPEIVTETEINTTEEEKSPVHDPAIAQPNHHSSHPYKEYSEYHQAAIANGPPSYDTYVHKYPHHSPVHATIIPHSRAPGVGAAIVTAHRNPMTTLFPGRTVSGISSYSNSDKEHIPAVAVSGVSFSRHPGHSPAKGNPSKVPYGLSGYASYGGHHYNSNPFHPSHSTALGTGLLRGHPTSIWDRATKHGAEKTEKTVLRFPFTFSAISEFSKPLWSRFRSRSDDGDNQEDKLEASLPKFNETDMANSNLTNLMKYEEVVQTNRQKWEIPVDETVMQSTEFKNFWVVYKQYLEHQLLLLQSKYPQVQNTHTESLIADALPKPESTTHIYDSHADVYDYCRKHIQSPYPLFQEDVVSCRHFFKCYRGDAYHFQCASGTSFSSIENKCLHTQEVNCGLRL